MIPPLLCLNNAAILECARELAIWRFKQDDVALLRVQGFPSKKIEPNRAAYICHPDMVECRSTAASVAVLKYAEKEEVISTNKQAF